MVMKYQANERLRTLRAEDVKKMEVRNRFQLYVSSWRHLSVKTLGTRRSGLGIIALGYEANGLFARPNNTLNKDL